MNALTRFDTTALNRALIGFDRMFEQAVQSQSYPPYNLIKRAEDFYELEIAVAGFKMDEIDVIVNNNQLSIKGDKLREEDTVVEYLHRGLAYRNFERTFTLAEHMEVGTASIKDGVLRIEISRVVPEALKPRKIQIAYSE
jgi:molecular chaperone IbpA